MTNVVKIHNPVIALDATATELLPFASFFEKIVDGARPGIGRLVTLFGRRAESKRLWLTAVLQQGTRWSVLRSTIDDARAFPSITPTLFSAHIFERELAEQFGVTPYGHPWLKPVRFSGRLLGQVVEYPFFRVEGKEVHEVAVGPIHAGVIEPGHFRFMCHGEIVQHLEIQLGYQHRGVSTLLTAKDPKCLAPIVESIVGDTTVGHAQAYCQAIEALCEIEMRQSTRLARTIGLELERVAMHLAGLAGLSSDIGFLPGASTYGRLRTTAINSTMLLCGSRFGRTLLRPGLLRHALTRETAKTLLTNVDQLCTDIAIINDHFCASRTVRHRLKGVGIVSLPTAQSLGLVGMVARASGDKIDLRATHDADLYAGTGFRVRTEGTGDCWARALLRIHEIDESLNWLQKMLATKCPLEAERVALGPLKANTLAISVVEGWRGEVVHCLETGSDGRLIDYRVQDPSLRNWFGLALALRGNAISDFPICNKSFDLSYCGNDL